MSERHAGGGCVGPVIRTINCGDPNCPMRYENTVPMNDAAREQRAKQGLPPHPDDLGPGTTPDDFIDSMVRKLFGP